MFFVYSGIMFIIMRNQKLAAITLFFLVLLYVLHVQGMAHHFYLNYWFYDVITHFLGGVCIALSALYLTKNPKHIISVTIVCGIIWEIFEVYFDITGWPISSRAYQLDTIKDMIMDTLGALSVWLIVRNKK